MSSEQYPSIGSDNGLAPARRQAIVWTNDGYFTDAYMRHSASMSWCDWSGLAQGHNLNQMIPNGLSNEQEPAQ